MTPDEDQQVSLQDDIGNAFDAASTDDVSVDEVVEPVAESPIEDTPELEPLVAVERWDKGLKDTFDEWGGIVNGRNYQQAMLDYHTQQQGYHTKLEQDIAPLRAESEAWGGVFNPHNDFLMHNGLSPQDAARKGLGIMANMSSDPTKFALDILQRTNYDFAAHGQDAPYVPPEVQAMQRELDQMRSTLQGSSQQAQRNEASQLNQQIQSFAGATNESGELLHPHYQAVEQDMARAVHGFRGMNQPIPPLATLYENACMQNPDIQAHAKAEEVAATTARKAASAKKAKQAAQRTSGTHTGTDTTKSSLKDDIGDLYDKQAAA